VDRVAVFVDAGYLFAQGSVELHGEKLTRGELLLDHEAVVSKLHAFAEQVSGLPLLRIYWYDGTSQGPTSQHITLAGQANVKIRLGFVNSVGQQKGVDSLIVTDMITLARNRAMAECVLLSGDEDLRVGVQQAQEYGIRVYLLGIRPARGNQSIFLLQEADATYQWEASDLGTFMKCSPRERPDARSDAPSTPIPATPSGGTDLLENVARQVAATVPRTDVAALVNTIRATNSRPRDIDAQLLATSRRELGHDLNPSQKLRVRSAFLTSLETRLNDSTDPTPETAPVSTRAQP
jgi:uncharacterized LabA/DUF88 family protein